VKYLRKGGKNNKCEKMKISRKQYFIDIKKRKNGNLVHFPSAYHNNKQIVTLISV
jgi:hypothetical protein